jgi:hypothetical protein
MDRAYAELIGGPRDGLVVPVDGHLLYEAIETPVRLYAGELPLPDHDPHFRVYHLHRQPLCHQRASDPARGYRYVLQPA